jgi:catechol 2,3-dioxygenase-like lactoylglutathione lyase family enzyme
MTTPVIGSATRSTTSVPTICLTPPSPCGSVLLTVFQRAAAAYAARSEAPITIDGAAVSRRRSSRLRPIAPEVQIPEDVPMSHVKRFDHVGITVADLDAVTAFFVGLGLEVEGQTFVEGEFVDTVIGIPGSRSHIVMLRPPGGGAGLELSSFVWPDHEPGSPTAMANELGLRNVAFEVDDLQATVDRLAADGYGLVGGIGQYENTWRMAYVRGPEGIIVSLAARIG